MKNINIHKQENLVTRFIQSPTRKLINKKNLSCYCPTVGGRSLLSSFFPRVPEGIVTCLLSCLGVQMLPQLL